MSVSSLLKSSETARKKQREYEESVYAYEWQLSDKTYEDFQAYSNYLKGLQTSSSDPSDKLSYDKKINSAQSGYISNEIQRQSIAVLEGQSSNIQKQEQMVSLYYMAFDNGNLDLAQNLRLQIDNLDLRIQREAEAAQGTADKLAKLNAQSIEEAVDTLKGYSDELNDLFREKGEASFTKEMADYATELGVEAGDFFGMKLRIAEEINSVYDNALASDSNAANQRKFQQAKNKFLTENQITLPSASGGAMKISYQDLADHVDARRTGQEVFRTIQTSEGTVFERNQQTGYVWGRDANGNYRLIDVYKPSVDYTSGTYKTRTDSKGRVQYLDSDDRVVAVKGKDGQISGVDGRTLADAERRSYEDLLSQSGFNVVGKSDGFITVATPQELRGLGIGADTVRLYVGADGKLQVMGEGEQLYNFEFDDVTGQFRGIQRDVPSPITLVDDQFSREFIDSLDRSRLSPGTIGIVDTELASKQLLTVAEFTRADIAEKARLQALENARIASEERAKQAALAIGQMQPAASAQALQPAANINRFQPAANANTLQPATYNPQNTVKGSQLQGPGASGGGNSSIAIRRGGRGNSTIRL